MPLLHSIPSFVLTGGPSAGKTSALSRLRQRLPTFGYTPIFSSEVASDIFSCGFSPLDFLGSPANVNTKRWRQFQKQMVRTIIGNENSKRAFAQMIPERKFVLICDRGAMDCAPYLDTQNPLAGIEAFPQLLQELDLSVEDARDKRYDAVFVLVSAACGAEHFYEPVNSDGVERESLERARALDHATAKAWEGHRRLRIIDNSDLSPSGERTLIEFETKMERLMAEVARVLGLPVPSNREHKYLLAPHADLRTLGAVPTTSYIEQTYLLSSEPLVERSVRKVRPGGSSAKERSLFIYREKTYLPEGGRRKLERVIDVREYLTLLKDADPTRRRIEKERHSFIWERQYLNLDVFQSHPGLKLLEVEPTEGQKTVLLPGELPVEREVSDDPAYRNATLASI